MFTIQKNNNYQQSPKLDKYGKIWANSTTLFLLPALLDSRVYNKEYGFINAYLQDHHNEVLHPQHLHLVFNPLTYNKSCQEFFERLEKKHPYFEEIYETLPGHLGKTVIVLKYPDDWKKNIDLVLEGKFSHIPPEYMESKMTPTHTSKGDLTIQWQIYTKHEKLRERLESTLDVSIAPDAELWAVPELKDEILNYNENVGYVR